MTHAKEDMRCVVLRAGSTVCDDVAAVLAERQWTAVSTDRELTAMTRLLLLDGVARDRQAWAFEPRRPAGLIVEQADRWTHLRSMLRAVARYLPETPVWLVLDDGELRRLELPGSSVASASASSSGRGAEQASAAQESSADPRHGLVPDGGDDEDAHSPPGRDAENGSRGAGDESATLVSSEEINLLMQDMEPEQDGRHS